MFNFTARGNFLELFLFKPLASVAPGLIRRDVTKTEGLVGKQSAIFMLIVFRFNIALKTALFILNTCEYRPLRLHRSHFVL